MLVHDRHYPLRTQRDVAAAWISGVMSEKPARVQRHCRATSAAAAARA